VADPLKRSLSRRALIASLSCSAAASAMGRTPYGGRLRLAVPWPVASLEPASLSDGFSALFAGACCEPLYALDNSENPYPALADALPSKQGAGCRLALRPGLKTAAGRALAGVDVVATLNRARARGAAGLLGEIENPSVDPKDPLAVLFPQSSPDAVARALASPLLALVPRSFSPIAPDGCGAFKIELSRGRALLTRNPNAARGPAFLDAIEVTAVTDLAELLRGFETGATDIGWFGTGLYRAVKDAVPFEAPRYAFAVLMAGKAAGAWGAPGTLQALLDAVPAQQLSHLGVRALPTQPVGSAGSVGWGGPTTTIAVLSGAPQLGAIARALAATLSTPGHELTVVEKTAEELAGLQTSRQFGLLLACVRAPTAAPRDLEMALRTAASPEAAKRAPRTALRAIRDLGRQLPLGIVGELAIWGARAAPFVNLEIWQLGAAWFRPAT
jgi:peptide/nickel transport system substrate-binding protein